MPVVRTPVKPIATIAPQLIPRKSRQSDTFGHTTLQDIQALLSLVDIGKGARMAGAIGHIGCIGVIGPLHGQRSVRRCQLPARSVRTSGSRCGKVLRGVYGCHVGAVGEMGVEPSDDVLDRFADVRVLVVQLDVVVSLDPDQLLCADGGVVDRLRIFR